MSLLMRKRVILAKAEATYGTDPTPTGAANAMLVRSLDVQPANADLVQRELIRPYLGNFDTLVASQFSTLTFEIEMAGSGTAGTAPAYAPLLLACAMGETVSAGVSVTYAPVSSSFGSVTIYFNVDGVLHKITGAMGTVEFTIDAKQIPLLKFTMTGIYNAPTDTAAPTPTYTAFKVPLASNNVHTPSFSFLSFSAILKSWNLNISGDVQHRVLIGSEAIRFLDRKPGGTIVIEAPTVASKDYFTAAVNATTGSMSIVQGTAAGNIVTIAAPRVSIGNPTYQDDAGVAMLSIPYSATPSSGNDEFSLVFT